MCKIVLIATSALLIPAWWSFFFIRTLWQSSEWEEDKMAGIRGMSWRCAETLDSPCHMK